MHNLEILRQKTQSCQDCPLWQRRTNVVFGEGNPAAPLVLVGEGPGDNEDKTGRPFVGKAGQLLDKALYENQLSRDDVYICNTVKCRAADWSTGKPQNRPPTESETLACRRWLVPQLQEIGPYVILCIGAPSAKNLIDKNFKITKQRGIFYPSEFARTVLATLHPSYILRNAHSGSDGGYSLLLSDIAKAWKAAIDMRERGLKTKGG
jgi:DNA polymerase